MKYLARFLHWLAFKLEPNEGVKVAPLNNGGFAITFHDVTLAHIKPQDIRDTREKMEKLEGPAYDLDFDRWWRENKPKDAMHRTHSIYSIARQAWNDRGKIKG